MKKKLHVKTKIFFPNPYVFRVKWVGIPDAEVEELYRKFCRKIYRTVQGTWGHSELRVFITENSNFAYESYIVFQEEMDVLQVKLMCAENLVSVKMWPSLYFTIHEVEYEKSINT